MKQLDGTVDVSGKPATPRRAVAQCVLTASEDAITRIREDTLPKRGAVGTARAAGLLAAKRAADLIPHCHPIALTSTAVDFHFEANTVKVTCEVSALDRTGPEMEALCGATLAALTLYDLIKAICPGPRLDAARLLEKEGGKSGHWRAEEQA